VWALVSFLTFKQGFVRHDAHATLFFATMLGALVGFRWELGQRLTGALMLALATMAFFGSTHADPRDLLHPVTRTNLFFAEASLMIHGTRLSVRSRGPARDWPGPTLWTSRA